MRRFLIFLCAALTVIIAIYLLLKTHAIQSANNGEKEATKATVEGQPSQKNTINSATPQNQQLSQLSTTSVVSNSSSVQDYIQKKMADPQYDWKQPINFWGRILDEKNEPVTDASIHFVWNDLSENGTSEADTKSDNNGFFSLLNRTGKRLSVDVSKSGYYGTSSSKCSFEYANPGDGLFKPDQGNPVVFRLRKKGEGESLVQNDKEITVGIGKVASLQLDDRTTLQVELLTNAPMSARQWAARVSVINGGIQPALDEFPFEAPLEGYETEMKLDIDTPKPTTWMSLYQGGQFYVKTATGYGRIELRMISGKSFMRVTSILNPTGSQNLESK